MNKNKGVLLAVSSLTGNYGIGDFTYAKDFICWLKSNNYKYWQILPLNPLGEGNSPYMSICSEAIEERYISLEQLFDQKLIKKLPKKVKASFSSNFELSKSIKEKYLLEAYENFKKYDKNHIKNFILKYNWVISYARFVYLKNKHLTKSWTEFSTDELNYIKGTNNDIYDNLDEINFIVFKQMIALRQWEKILSFANKNGIKIISDIPFYVGYDSVDFITHENEFLIKDNHQLTYVSGVGPDYFSKDGQLWGTPIYDFKKMKENNYSFLINRLIYCANLSNLIRLDHFRAFDTYYVIPSEEKTALNGKWEIGPRESFFFQLYKKKPDIHLIAEDLGELFPSVIELRNRLDLPGMHVCIFNLLNNYNEDTSNKIVYSGTHDNDTLLGFLNKLNTKDKSLLCKKFHCNSKQLFDKVYRYIDKLPSLITIFPIQDILKMNSRFRMNTPGIMNDKNWKFKLKNKIW